MNKKQFKKFHGEMREKFPAKSRERVNMYHFNPYRSKDFFKVKDFYGWLNYMATCRKNQLISSKAFLPEHKRFMRVLMGYLKDGDLQAVRGRLP